MLGCAARIPETTCWTFDAEGLQPAWDYRLTLVDSDDKPLCDPWSLSTFPAPGDRPRGPLERVSVNCRRDDRRQTSGRDRSERAPRRIRRRDQREKGTALFLSVLDSGQSQDEPNGVYPDLFQRLCAQKDV